MCIYFISSYLTSLSVLIRRCVRCAIYENSRGRIQMSPVRPVLSGQTCDMWLVLLWSLYEQPDWRLSLTDNHIRHPKKTATSRPTSLRSQPSAKPPPHALLTCRCLSADCISPFWVHSGASLCLFYWKLVPYYYYTIFNKRNREFRTRTTEEMTGLVLVAVIPFDSNSDIIFYTNGKLFNMTDDCYSTAMIQDLHKPTGTFFLSPVCHTKLLL